MEIKSKEDLIRAVDYMHDSGIKSDGIVYDSTNKIFSMLSKEYEFKGKIIQRQTSIVKASWRLRLRDVKACHVSFRSNTDKNGYQALGEDYINTIQIKENCVVISALFQKIVLEVKRFDGELERK